MLTLGELLLALVVLALVRVYFDGLRIRELALQAGRDYCRETGLQLLDETVAHQRIGIARDRNGQLRVRRSFRFEFTSDGERRYRGDITMLGSRVERVWVELHRVVH